MSIVSTIKQSLSAGEDLVSLPFQLTQEAVGNNDSLTGRFLKQFSQIGQTAATMPLQIAKNLLDDEPQNRKTNSSRPNREFLNRWEDEDSDRLEQLGRS
ncbi:MAG: hypothetical protein GX750_06025 [Clostridia bacterium]|nr:hypothetical protein [Clostridia bacterium]